MIEIRLLSVTDIGRNVIYRCLLSPIEQGKISSWNDTMVFVSFLGNIKACYPSTLEWL